MRAIDWMKPYKEKYDRFLHTGNPATDMANAILLHGEGDGSQFPSLFAVDNAEEIAAKSLKGNDVQASVGNTSVPPPIIPQADISVFVAVSGQQYGPYTLYACKQMVQQGQLNPQSLVWMEGLSAWTPANQVPVLQPLFAPTMPPLPPTNGSIPPPIA